ncbi:hypothetical protein FQR65_LT13404 [Abscondita terminalis]|nr:hypothetical protein FQR65_LT13404 [Abscondita terminalis]
MITHSSLIISSFIYLISLVNFSSTECIPVYMWGNIQYNEPISPLQVTDQESFLNFLENKLDKKNPIVVFAEQSLSPEDFLLRNEKDESVFSTLPPLQDSSTVNYWPCVKNPVDALDKLKDRNVVKTTLNTILSKSIKLEPADLMVIDLNDAEENEGRIDMLQRHDDSFNKIYKHLQKSHGGVTMLFTAHQPSWITVNEIRSHRRIRDTSKAEDGNTTDSNYVVYRTSDVLISALNTSVLHYNNDIIPLNDVTVTSDNQTENDLHVTMTLNDSVSIKWFFKKGGGYWLLENLTLTGLNTGEQEDSFRVREFYAPRRFSYHCAKTIFVHNSNSQINMTFEDFQIQIFLEDGDDTSKFGDAYDCTGFMSSPIWSGLFVTFILVLIMTCGLTTMMEIKTMDRFDDPKGKTITINASE